VISVVLVAKKLPTFCAVGDAKRHGIALFNAKKNTIPNTKTIEEPQLKPRG
jgi:hypothetical protein